VKLKNATYPKIYDRGKLCMFVRYSLEHAGDTIRMWNPDTNNVLLSRDTIWMNQMFFKENFDVSQSQGILKKFRKFQK
jgi:hypothetical protein